MKTAYLIVLSVLCGISACAQIPVINGLSNLLNRPITPGKLPVQPLVDVIENGVVLRYVADPTNALATNRFLIGTNSVGRWKHDWDGDVRAFGAMPDDGNDDSVALQSAANYAINKRICLYLPAGASGGIYHVTNTIVMTNAANNRPTGGGFRGDGIGRSRILHTGFNQPVVKMRGLGMQLSNLTVGYTYPQGNTNTSSYCIEFPGFNSMHSIHNVQTVNGYAGIMNTSDDSGYAMFSCTFQNITLENCDQGIDIVSGSGNVFQNVYFSAYGLPSATRAVIDRAGSSVWNQLNIEHSNFRSCPFTLQSDGGMIGNLHYEGIRVFNSEPLINLSESAVPIEHWTIINSYFNGHMLSAITRVGTNATATVNDLGDAISGHGIAVGDTIYVQGATDALYNGAKLILSVTSSNFTFGMSGTPAADAVVNYAGGYDYLSANRGTASASLSALADTTLYGGSTLLIRSLSVRDNRVINAASANRNGLLILNETNGKRARAFVDSFETASLFEPQIGRYLAANPVVAASVSGGVGTFYTGQPHWLATNELAYVQANTAGVRTSTNWTVLTTPTAYSFTVPITSSDVAFTREVGGGFVAQVAALVTNRSRTGNIATAYCDRPHGLKVGYKCAIHNSTDSSFNNTAAAAISVPSSYIFTYRSVGSDSAATNETQAIVTVYDAGISGFLMTSTHTGLKKFADLFDVIVATSSNTLASGSADSFTNTVNGLRIGDVVRLAPLDPTQLPSDLLVSGIAGGNNTLVVTRRNVGSGSITNLGGVWSVQFHRP